MNPLSSYPVSEQSALEEAAAWLLAAHDARLFEVTLFLERFCGDQHTYFNISLAATRVVGSYGATLLCRDMGILAEVIFRHLRPTARFELAFRDVNLAAEVTLRAADLSAHRRLSLLRRHGDRETVMLQTMEGILPCAGRT